TKPTAGRPHCPSENPDNGFLTTVKQAVSRLASLCRTLNRKPEMKDQFVTFMDEEAIDLLKRTKASLAESNLHLHKIASNSQVVMEAFLPEDHAKGIKDLDFTGDTEPTQRSLGLCWEIQADTFTFRVTVGDKPYTRRGVLSTVNSLFDPLGFVAPVTIRGRALLRELTSHTSEWDKPLPEEKRQEWETWRDSLKELKHLHIPRKYTASSLSQAAHTELCVFSDASTKAIGAVAYIRSIGEDGKSDVGFVFGKARLAPQSEPTIPRLELCAAVMAVEIAEFILSEMDLQPNAVKFYSDSKVVLGYIHSQTKRFYVYVHNRVQRIRQSKPEQWLYVPSEQNPADCASRSVQVSHLTDTSWLSGPAFLHQCDGSQVTPQLFDLVDPDKDVEVRPEVKSCVTQIREKGGLTTDRFKRFSTWSSLVNAVASLIHIVRSCKAAEKVSGCQGWHKCSRPCTPEDLSQASDIIIKSVQSEAFREELAALADGKTVNKNSPLFKFNPRVDEGLIRIGGRLNNAQVESVDKNPLILPKQHHVSTLLVRHYHEKGEFSDKDLHGSQWKQVQAVAERFWAKWRREYLPTLQARRKWNKPHRNLQKGDVVLLRDDHAARNVWPMALVESVCPSADGKVRKVQLRTVNQGTSKTLLRPMSQVIFLFADVISFREDPAFLNKIMPDHILQQSQHHGYVGEGSGNMVVSRRDRESSSSGGSESESFRDTEAWKSGESEDGRSKDNKPSKSEYNETGRLSGTKGQLVTGQGS
ncbi:hypothetical protein NFI96_032236, partial [Prochilodus magdalenae]